MACLKLVLKVGFKNNLIAEAGKIFRCDNVDSESSYSLDNGERRELGNGTKDGLIHFLPSRMTQAAIVDTGMADSSQRRFIISCLSRGASNLLMCQGQKKLGHLSRNRKTPEY